MYVVTLREGVVCGRCVVAAVVVGRLVVVAVVEVVVIGCFEVVVWVVVFGGKYVDSTFGVLVVAGFSTTDTGSLGCWSGSEGFGYS